jgi:hypothetical protein
MPVAGCILLDPLFAGAIAEHSEKIIHRRIHACVIGSRLNAERNAPSIQAR